MQAQGTGGSYSGAILKTNGPYFGDQFDPSGVGIANAGSGWLLFSNSNSGVFQYTVDGVEGTKNITRQVIE
jgi:hypothetical protein